MVVLGGQGLGGGRGGRHLDVDRERILAAGGLVGIDGQPLNPIWNAAQLIEVWASSAERAKEVVEAKYPQNAGYRVLSVAFVGGPKATVST